MTVLRGPLPTWSGTSRARHAPEAPMSTSASMSVRRRSRPWSLMRTSGTCCGRTISVTTRARRRRCSSCSRGSKPNAALHRVAIACSLPDPAPGLLAPLRRRQGRAGSRRGRSRRRAAAPERALRVGNRGRGHENDLLHSDRQRPDQTGLHAVRLQWRHRNLCRKDRAQAADSNGELCDMGYAGHDAAQSQFQVRHLRRGGREHAREIGRARRGNYREPVRGGGLSEPRDAHQGQYADAGGAPAGWAESLLHRTAGGVASSPAKALGGARIELRRRSGSCDAHPGPVGCALLRLPRVRSDRHRTRRRAWASIKGRNG